MLGVETKAARPAESSASAARRNGPTRDGMRVRAEEDGRLIQFRLSCSGSRTDERLDGAARVPVLVEIGILGDPTGAAAA